MLDPRIKIKQMEVAQPTGKILNINFGLLVAWLVSWLVAWLVGCLVD
jgi:hypothetical protein